MGREEDIKKLVARVQALTSELDAVPERTRALAALRRESLRRLVDACDGNVREAARRLSWPPTTAYRVVNGDTTARRKALAREYEG